MAPLDHISSELIEQYVLGLLSAEQSREVEAAATGDPELRARIDELQDGLARLAQQQAVTPPAGVKSRIMAAIAVEADSDRPPILHPASKVSDYSRWIDVPGMERPTDAGEIFFIPFAENSDGQSALVWLTTGSPEETHTDSIEKFLIMEGSCEIVFNGIVHTLVPGSVLSIPLHTPHLVKVTSTIPCKIILQRIAA